MSCIIVPPRNSRITTLSNLFMLGAVTSNRLILVYFFPVGHLLISEISSLVMYVLDSSVPFHSFNSRKEVE